MARRLETASSPLPAATGSAQREQSLTSAEHAADADGHVARLVVPARAGCRRARRSPPRRQVAEPAGLDGDDRRRLVDRDRLLAAVEGDDDLRAVDRSTRTLTAPLVMMLPGARSNGRDRRRRRASNSGKIWTSSAFSAPSSPGTAATPT